MRLLPEVKLCRGELLLEQLEERIVLDGPCESESGGDCPDLDAEAVDATDNSAAQSDGANVSVSAKWTDIGSGWLYEESGNYGLYSDGTTVRFAYDLTSQTWLQYDAFNGWSVMSDSGMPSDFVGDGKWYSVGGNLTFCYSGGFAAWAFDGTVRFAYDHSSGYWLQNDPFSPKFRRGCIPRHW